LDFSTKTEEEMNMGLYAFGTFLIGTALIAFFCFFLSWIYGCVSTTSYVIGLQLGTNSAETELVKTFFDTTSAYIGIFMFIVLGFWAIVYSQKKGVQVE